MSQECSSPLWYPVVGTEDTSIGLKMNFGEEPFRFRDWTPLLDPGAAPVSRATTVDVMYLAWLVLRKLVMAAAETAQKAAETAQKAPEGGSEEGEALPGSAEGAARACLEEGVRRALSGVGEPTPCAHHQRARVDQLP